MVFIQVIAQVQTLLSFGWIAGCRSLNRRRILKIKEMSDPDLDSESLKMWLRPPLQQTRNSRSLPTILMQRRICLNATNSSAPQAAKNYMQALPPSFRTCATFRMGPSDHARLDAVSTDLKYWQVQAQRNDKRIEGRSWQLQYDFKRAKALDSWRIRGRSRAGLRVGGKGFGEERPALLHTKQRLLRHGHVITDFCSRRHCTFSRVNRGTLLSNNIDLTAVERTRHFKRILVKTVLIKLTS